MTAVRILRPDTQPKTKKPSDDLSWLLDGRPQVRDEIRRRLIEFPEYRTWLEHSGTGLLGAVENDS